MVFTSSSTNNNVVVTSGFANPIAAARNVDTSKALVPHDPQPATHSDRGSEVSTSENPTLVLSGQPVARLERSGEATKQSADISLVATQMKVDNTVVGSLQAEVEVTADRKVVQQSIEITDEGEIALRQYTQYERYTYTRVIEIMYIAALNEPEEPDNEKPAKKEILTQSTSYTQYTVCQV